MIVEGLSVVATFRCAWPAWGERKVERKISFWSKDIKL